MPPLIYGWNVYAIVFWMVYVVWFMLEIRGAVAQRVKADAKKQDRGSIVVLLVGLYVGLLLNFVCAGLFPGATLTWHRPILVSVGLVLMCWVSSCASMRSGSWDRTLPVKWRRVLISKWSSVGLTGLFVTRPTVERC